MSSQQLVLILWQFKLGIPIASEFHVHIFFQSNLPAIYATTTVQTPLAYFDDWWSERLTLTKGITFYNRIYSSNQ